MANCDLPGSPSDGFFRGDYAANGGSEPVLWRYGPANLADAQSGIGFESAATLSKANGLGYQRSEIRLADIPDGTSHTYLVGEKYLDPRHYDTGFDHGDDEKMLDGEDVGLWRWTFLQPKRDTPGFMSDMRFGSNHPGGFLMAMADASVQIMSYTISPNVHCDLGIRNDGRARQLP